MTSSLAVSPFLLLFLVVSLYAAAAGHYEPQQQQQQPLNPGDYTAAPVAGGEGSSSTGSTVPAFPVVQAQSNQTCHLDLSDELFGGVAEACGRNLDRAAAARCSPPGSSPPTPARRSNSRRHRRRHRLPQLPCRLQPHHTLHRLLRRAAGLLLLYRNATPTAAVRNLEKSCRNSSYAGCTRCLQSLDMFPFSGGFGCSSGRRGRGGAGAGGGDRASRMFGRDCQLMGLTWLLARNRTAYIPTVSAVLRAIMYSSHHLPPPHGGSGATGKQPQYRCSPDQENMPLAVDSLQFERLEDSAAGGGGGAVLPTVTPP
ncbi:unnamed protein product [Spirodela intermedia]|uniref:Uncharacterized protein n=1 Tax=Spirodela intermedia TaxID=51605 RepID=A0A7I8JPI1_SPIIN|nr:unnamed protein product [Spirodela intermedia]CAA6672020.1 unnamed protein product [Spirodela intermedia]